MLAARTLAASCVVTLPAGAGSGTVIVPGPGPAAPSPARYAAAEPPAALRETGGGAFEAASDAALDLPDSPPPPPRLNLPTGPSAGTVAGAPTAPRWGAIVLDDDGQDAEIICTGRDVVIHASDSRFRLRGGCRSVLVQGRADRIDAELAPGALISIGGDSVSLDYTLTGEGPPVSVSVTGSRSQAVPAP